MKSPSVEYEEWDVLPAHHATCWEPTVIANLAVQGQRLDTLPGPTHHDSVNVAVTFEVDHSLDPSIAPRDVKSIPAAL